MTNGPTAPFLKPLLLSLGAVALVLAGCESTPDPQPRPQPSEPVIAQPDPLDLPPPPDDEPEVFNPDDYVTTEALGDEEPVRVALLLPFSADSDNVRTIAQAMSNAAQMAAFESGNDRYLLIPKDTKGTPEGARDMAREALREGAEVVLGPLLSSSVEAAAEVTRRNNVPMIAFSSDMQIAGNGVYLLSFPPEMEVARVTDYAIKQGYSRFGILSPTTEYGQRVRNSFHEEAYVRGGVIVAEEQYVPSPDQMMQPARQLAQSAGTCDGAPRGPAAHAGAQGDPYSTGALSQNDYDGVGDYGTRPTYTGGGFQAVLMPEQGTNLRALAPLLPYYNVNVRCIKVLGVSAWNNPLLTREPALNGGWFAAPDPALSEDFRNTYTTVYGSEPPRLASLAYDAALLTASLAINPRETRFTADNIADPNGYLGADGLFRLTPDGRVERGLAILELTTGGIEVIDPAPTSFMTQGAMQGY